MASPAAAAAAAAAAVAAAGAADEVGRRGASRSPRDEEGGAFEGSAANPGMAPEAESPAKTAGPPGMSLSALGMQLSAPLDGREAAPQRAASRSPSSAASGTLGVCGNDGCSGLAAQQQQQEQGLPAAAAAAAASLREASVGDVAAARVEANSPLGSTTSVRSEDRSSTECGELLLAAVAAPAAAAGSSRDGAAEPCERTPGPHEGSPCPDTEGGRRMRPPRRAAAAAASGRRQSEEDMGPPLSMRPSVGSRVVTRLPGVKYCHSRNAWIARWSEEGQERWKTFSVKACKGFTEARMQAVQFRWEKVRLKYAKLMKQATPQPGLISCTPSEGSPPEPLEMDAEAAELAAALQMYGNGGQVRMPRSESAAVVAAAAAAPHTGRSLSPASSLRAAAATEAKPRQTTRQKRQGSALGATKLSADEPSRPAHGRGSGGKKTCKSPLQQQQLQLQEEQLQQREQLAGAADQLSASQWALLQQHLQLQSACCGSSNTSVSLSSASRVDGGDLGGEPPSSALKNTAQRAESAGSALPVKSDPASREGADAAMMEPSLRTQLFLRLAKRLQQSKKQQDTAVLLQALKSLILQRRQTHQEQDHASRLPLQQPQQTKPQQSSLRSSIDLESELLRLLANSTGLLGATGRNAGGGAPSPTEPSTLHSGQNLDGRDAKDLTGPPSSWDPLEEYGLTDSVNSLGRVFTDGSRPASVASGAAADAAAGHAVCLGAPQWASSSVNGSERPMEPVSGAHSWGAGGQGALVSVPSVAAASTGSTPFSMRDYLEGESPDEAVDLQPWRRAVCVILEDVLENCVLEVGSQQRQGSSLCQERLQFAPMVGRLKALAARSCSKAELRPFLRLFSRSIRLGVVPSKQSEDVQQLILDALGALDDVMAASRASQTQQQQQQQQQAQQLSMARGLQAEPSEALSPFALLQAGSGFS
ncbi:hypothetical protein, conserved [Eimeria tenella]|uniref:AP2-coincident C-terminal domain-containing protein n=1 Tax=Eimeria tenella TaxID=5802 RepID=U6KMG9_EIMTE|nr:hypothetical protein, conserved [Eimeria tenella]CDJ38006.1 hypothetical protein, conserved [Eimeria tenella]|eukprot:XP_013228844.1 hypothetical protein, conserved [Eimeria tenella]